MYNRIESLNAEDSQTSCIKAMVSSIKYFKTRENKECMSIILTDVNLSNIDCVFWPDAYKRFYNIIRRNHSYTFRNFRIEPVTNQWFNHSHHQFKIIVLPGSRIVKIANSGLHNGIEYVNVKKMITNEKVKQYGVKQFYGIKCTDHKLDDYFKVTSKYQKRTIIRNKQRNNIAISSDKGQTNHHTFKQPVITNFFA